MAGRKRKPSHLHAVEGTAQKCRMNPNEPVPPGDLPSSPLYLSQKAREYFDLMTERIHSLGIASVADTEKVMMLALRLEEIELTTKDIAENGAVFRSVKPIEGAFEADGNTVLSVTVRPNPAVSQRSNAMRQAQSLLSDFGLCPSSRGKVSAPKKTEPKSRWKSFGNS